MATASPRITCPDCKSVLKPIKPVPDGKRGKCPRCGSTFTTPGLVEGETFDVVEAVEDRPRKPKASGRKGKTGSKKADGAKPARKKKYVDDDEEGDGIYSVSGKLDDEDDKPDINYAPDM